MTTVVNIRNSKNYLYVGRGSIFGNPFSHMPGTKANVLTKTKEESIQYFKEWVNRDPKWKHVEPEQRNTLLASLYQLRNRRLGCYCSPLPCHADILAKMADGETNGA